MLDFFAEVCYNVGKKWGFRPLLLFYREEVVELWTWTAERIDAAQKTARIPVAEIGAKRTPRLDEIQTQLAELLDFNTVELVTAVNAEEAREAWLNLATTGRFTNPALEYDAGLAEHVAAKQPELEELYRALLAVAKRPVDSVERLRAQLLANRIEAALGATWLAYGILRSDDHLARQGAQMRYYSFGAQVGVTWEELVEQAKVGADDIRTNRRQFDPAQLTAEQVEKLQEMQVDARGIAKWFQWAVNSYGFDYSVEVDTAATAIDVRETSAAGHPRIVIPARRKMHGLKLVTLIRHEIDCHARDSQNGRELLWGLGGGACRIEDDVAYEGHAMTEENAMLRHCTGESPRQALPWYTLAIARADSGASFASVAEWIYQLRLRAGAKPDAALKNTWSTTYRVFRGISDTRNPDEYAFWKDKAYLQGTLEVGKLYDAGLGHWAELGSFRLDELAAIARVAQYSGDELPHSDLNTAQQVLENLLAS